MILIKVHDQEPPVAHRVDSFPCLIGRSMACSVRLEDPSVSGRHAQLEQSGDLYVLRDLGSTNGIISRTGAKVRELRLVANETVFLGDVQLELVVEEELPKTLLNRLPPEDPAPGGRTTPLKVVLSIAFAFFLLCAVPAADQYRIYWPPERPAELLGQAVVLWAALVGAAFVVSLFCKLNTKRFHFHRVLGLLVLTFVAAKAFGEVAPTLVYNLHNWPGAGGLLHLGYAVIAGVFIYHLPRYSFRRWRPRLRAFLALVAAVAAAGAVQVLLVQRGGFSDRDRIADLGLPLKDPASLRQNADDLVFDMALSIADTDQRRIRMLEKIEAERDAE